MHIKDQGYWYTDTVPHPSPEAFTELVRMRYETFRGFCELETEKGFLKMGTPYETSRGQEMLRILLFRTIEEYAESLDSSDMDHVKEELIDCFNYLLGARILELDSPDHPVLQTEGLPNTLHTAWVTAKELNGIPHRPTLMTLGQISHRLGQVGDMLRNRSWMNHTQDMYFTGRIELDHAIGIVSMAIFNTFKDFEDFYRYFVSKDRVLQFRLRSKY